VLASWRFPRGFFIFFFFYFFFLFGGVQGWLGLEGPSFCGGGLCCSSFSNGLIFFVDRGGLGTNKVLGVVIFGLNGFFFWFSFWCCFGGMEPGRFFKVWYWEGSGFDLLYFFLVCVFFLFILASIFNFFRWGWIAIVDPKFGNFSLHPSLYLIFTFSFPFFLPSSYQVR